MKAAAIDALEEEANSEGFKRSLASWHVTARLSVSFSLALNCGRWCNNVQQLRNILCRVSDMFGGVFASFGFRKSM